MIREEDLRNRIKNTVPDRVQSAIDTDVAADCPHGCLCHNVTEKRIAELTARYSDNTLRTDAVYVLQCKPRQFNQRVVREELQLQYDSRWAEQAQQAEVLIYVGVSINLPKRLKQHARAKGSGANFTQMFPAARLLSVQWYQSKRLAYKAEELTAEILEGELTNDAVYVAQPG